MSLPDSPFAEVLDALWRRIDDSTGGANLLHQWANSENPGTGLTTFRVDDTEGAGFPRSINSTESPAIHIGNAPSQKYGWAVTRTIELPEQFIITGVVTSRDQRTREKFLWLVLRALWFDYPCLHDSNGIPLGYIKKWYVGSANRGVQISKNNLPFWKFAIPIQVDLQFTLHAFMQS